MFLSYITLAVALSLSVIAAFYSIAGLAAIFAAAVVPIIVMGSILELGKVVVTLWLHEYWRRCRFLMKAYLVPAVAVLMLITSMGIFGFLSKAHSDQGMISGDVQAKIAVYDEKIQTEKDNIDANRKALKQLDEAVDQVMGRSTTETGAQRAVQIRRSQQAERGRLLKEIAESQKRIAALNEERAPIAAEVRKVEAEVGPIKYIAALVYGDSADANLLEAAVRWVIILLVVVFDPLAIMMLLAATESLKWEKQRVFEALKLAPTESDPVEKPEPTEDAVEQKVSQDPHPTGWMFPSPDEPEPEKSILEQHPYLTKGFAHFTDLKPMVYKPEEPVIYSGDPKQFQEPWPEEKTRELVSAMENIFVDNEEEFNEEHPSVKAAMKQWKEQNPDSTLKEQRAMLVRGEIDVLPWMKLVADNELPREPLSTFGPVFPEDAKKGDSHVRTDKMPNQVFKHNGTDWILVDKNHTANYTYNEAYIDHLISKIDTGEYDIDLLSDNEREQIAQRLQTRNT